jgi:hypothetical protein
LEARDGASPPKSVRRHGDYQGNRVNGNNWARRLRFSLPPCGGGPGWGVVAAASPKC